MKLYLNGGGKVKEVEIHDRPHELLWGNRGRKEWQLIVFEVYNNYSFLELYHTSKGLLETLRIDHKHLGKLGYAFYDKCNIFKLIPVEDSSSVIYRNHKRIRLIDITIHKFEDAVRFFFTSEKKNKRETFLSYDMPNLFFEEILKFSQEKVLQNL